MILSNWLLNVSQIQRILTHVSRCFQRLLYWVEMGLVYVAMSVCSHVEIVGRTLLLAVPLLNQVVKVVELVCLTLVLQVGLARLNWLLENWDSLSFRWNWLIFSFILAKNSAFVTQIHLINIWFTQHLDFLMLFRHLRVFFLKMPQSLSTRVWGNRNWHALKSLVHILVLSVCIHVSFGTLSLCWFGFPALLEWLVFLKSVNIFLRTSAWLSFLEAFPEHLDLVPSEILLLHLPVPLTLSTLLSQIWALVIQLFLFWPFLGFYLDKTFIVAQKVFTTKVLGRVDVAISL